MCTKRTSTENYSCTPGHAKEGDFCEKCSAGLYNTVSVKLLITLELNCGFVKDFFLRYENRHNANV